MANEASQVFGRRKESHVLILASGDRIRHMVVHPWLAALAVATVLLLSVGYVGATAYLLLRDDLIGASMARQARMQHEYEDRIAALRAQVDRITSRQLLDQQVVEEKVEKLLAQQMALTSRQGKLGQAIERAEDAGLDALSDRVTDDATPVSDRHALSHSPVVGGPSAADRADRMFSRVMLSLKDLERRQLAHIQALTANAAERAGRIEDILKNTGLKLMAGASEPVGRVEPDTAMGGPYLAPRDDESFETSLSELDFALDKLEHVKTIAARLPFSNPAPGREITSSFGNRLDPFFGRLAMHAGIDFRQKTGSSVLSAGAGTIVSAGPAGGYGNMVEIDHGDGITTRYGHLSRILVDVGQHVEEGDLIAASGSTGRSTGPHLHYEVRRNGQAVDPMRFLNAGLKLNSYMK